MKLEDRTLIVTIAHLGLTEQHQAMTAVEQAVFDKHVRGTLLYRNVALYLAIQDFKSELFRAMTDTERTMITLQIIGLVSACIALYLIWG